MSILDTANKIRADLKKIQARISKAANEKIEKTRELEQIEKTCSHLWGKAEPVMVNKMIVRDRYYKVCSKCGMEKQSTGVSIKF